MSGKNGGGKDAKFPSDVAGVNYLKETGKKKKKKKKIPLLSRSTVSSDSINHMFAPCVIHLFYSD